MERRRHRAGLRHEHRADHPATTVQVSPDLSTLKGARGVTDNPSDNGDGQQQRDRDADLAGLERLRSARDRIREQIRGTIVGQDEVVEQLLACLFARGHCILEGVPGLAKTLLVRTLARCLSLEFARIQFTPDLMPSDITGTDVMYED